MSATHKSVLLACGKLLPPLVAVLLKLGVTAADFDELVREVFVTTAAMGMKRKTRRVNQSRIAIITGLTRSEVGRILRRVRYAKARRRHLHRADRVLKGWFEDPGFLTRKGKPRALRISGGNGTFQDLVRRYSGDIPARAMLDELTARSAVRIQANGSLKAAVRKVRIPKIRTRDIEDLGIRASALLETICTNIESKDSRLPVSSTLRRRVDERILALVLRRIKQQGTALLESIDDQLTHPPRGYEGKGRFRGPRLGVTLFVHRSADDLPSG